MIIIVDKPAGFTSHDVVAKIKHAAGNKIKIGHTGTLDPMCTGVLTVLTGNYTKLSDILPSDKKYRAEIRFGITTDTQDITGNVLEECACDVSLDDFTETAENFVGRVSQVPPMYSAIKKNGVPLYKLARNGENIEREPREIEIYSIDNIAKTDKNTFSFDVFCSSGTYIRTLCEDIGNSLGTGACMLALRRISANGFDISDAHKLEDVIACAKDGRLDDCGIGCEKAFSELERLVLPENAETYYLNGGAIDGSRFNENVESESRYLIYNSRNEFVGIAESDECGKVRSLWKSL